MYFSIFPFNKVITDEVILLKGEIITLFLIELYLLKNRYQYALIMM
jgi:hypothetical protein